MGGASGLVGSDRLAVGSEAPMGGGTESQSPENSAQGDQSGMAAGVWVCVVVGLHPDYLPRPLPLDVAILGTYQQLLRRGPGVLG